MLNHITLMGRLTKDPELRYTNSSVPVASFTLACERDYGAGEDGKKQADFVECVAWRGTGEFISKYFAKGRMMVVSGRLQSQKWQDRDGKNRTSWEINVDNAYFGDSKRDGDGGNQSAEYAPPPRTQFTDIEDDEDDGELPF